MNIERLSNCKSMKVGILTLPLHSNFGYLMQAYALQTIIKELGHQPYTIYTKEEPTPYSRRVTNAIKRIIKNILYNSDYTVFPYYPSSEDYILKDKNTWDFIKKNLSLSPYLNIETKEGIEHVCDYDAYVVGSDQVWRREYSGDIAFYFFDFLTKGQKRMSYAASFGNSSPSYSPKLIDKCKRLLDEFDFITVRENDAVDICRTLFSKEALQVLDPTLLLSKADYEKLIDEDVTETPKEKYIFSYILDKSPEKELFINELANKKHCIIYNILPKRLEDVGKSHIEECIYPSISSWLSAFKNAEYIVTDSFHGTVFSILFNKDFSVFCNKKRGASRIESLLNDLNLQDRMVVNNNNRFDRLIAYGTIEDLLQSKRLISIETLKSFLQ